MTTRLTLISIFVALLGSSCVYFRSASVPMPMVVHPAPAANANGLVVMLPGMGDGPSYYESHGLVEMVQKANPRFDVICADSHFGYYRQESIVERLHLDVIQPVAGRYEHIWLVGISLGGLGCVAYTDDHPEQIDGVILMAPFMGSDEVIDEVRKAGGPRMWTRPTDTDATTGSETRFRDVWVWYQNVLMQPATSPKLLLGYGEQDRFAETIAMVATELPAAQVLTRPGGHKWTVWKQLFAELSVRALRDLR
ncbi:MAG: pimeloyl-ACP methyl ester carboxylesterase [Planctomycetota bacterium]|jgi:pimeloyl-ACP methyl ester carboxylesterase